MQSMHQPTMHFVQQSKGKEWWSIGEVDHIHKLDVVHLHQLGFGFAFRNCKEYGLIRKVGFLQPTHPLSTTSTRTTGIAGFGDF